MKDYKKLCPFKGWVLENFPFIEADFDAITNYELICKVVEYLNKMGTQFNDMIDNLNYLNNWLENLNLQDEVDNKLDEMAESGELQEIIADYLNTKAIFCFDNVESLKESNNLIEGSYAKTLGYYSIDDGGESQYKIRKVTNNDVIDESFLIALSDETLVAELITDGSVTIAQLGCVDNDESKGTFNKEKIELAFTKVKNVIVPIGRYYTNTINIPADITLKGINEENSILAYIGDNNKSLITVGGTSQPFNVRVEKLHLIQKGSLTGINAIEFLSNNPAYGIYKDLKITDFTGDGIKGGHLGNVNNVKIVNCFISACVNGINLQYKAGQINAIWIEHNNIVACTNAGVLFYGNNVIIKENTIQANNIGVSIGESTWDTTYNQNCFASKITDNYFEQNTKPIQIYHGYVVGRTYNRLIRKLEIIHNYFLETVNIVTITPDSSANLSSRSCIVYIKYNTSSATEFIGIDGNNAISTGSEIYQNTVGNDTSNLPYFVKQAETLVNSPSTVHHDNYQTANYNYGETIAANATKQTTFLIYFDTTALSQSVINQYTRSMNVELFVSGNYNYGVAGRYSAHLLKASSNVSTDYGSIDLKTEAQYNIPFISPITLVKNHPDLTGNASQGLQFTIVQQGTNAFPYELFIKANCRYDINKFITIKKLTPDKSMGSGTPGTAPSYPGQVYFNTSARKWLVGGDNSDWITTDFAQ